MGRMMTDVLMYTLARIALVVVLTVVIYYGAKAFGVQNLPTYVAALFGLVIAMPLGIWLLRPLRQRATASIAVIDEGRRAERERLQSRLRGEDDA
ncbi:DUF4229 domain-containing protein [Mycolicibacterium brumae]|uniref:DUF4229 domain-containing protein n=2 Tax=Mycolicibacterium brumae TaxID=85968 RepID=A0A2G5PHS2_9MYCO|nr:DUF4229 domain-containing protein [Mycolicibacterium brumae]RWA18548.1 hypothetical protein MBRU_04835 [Mycolicibacterium brumae DSM 44177]